MVKVGEQAPEISGHTAEGKTLGLADLRGKPVVLYFYPKDDTPVCTKESCSFRDHAGEISAMGGVVVGVSSDSPESHGKFASKYGLRFPLLSDPDGAIAKAFGVARLGGFLAGWIPPRRVTFVIDSAGVVQRIIESEFSADKHIDGALDALRELATREKRAS